MKKNSLFPIIVISFSVLEIADSLFRSFHWPALINAALGIIGGTLYFLKNEKYRQFIYTWIYLQFVAITKTIVEPNSLATITYPVIDFTQLFIIKLGFTITLNTTSYFIAFNFLPLLYLFVFKKLQTTDLIGRQLSLNLYRDNEILNSVLPQTITVLESIDFEKSSGWLLAQLSSSIDLNGQRYEYCLIKSKDDLPIFLMKKGRLHI